MEQDEARIDRVHGYIPFDASGNALRLGRNTSRGYVMQKLGILLVVKDGNFEVQLFADPDKAKSDFDQWAGIIGDPPSKATLVTLSYLEDGSVDAKAECKDLPVDVESLDGWKLGEGPVEIKDDEEKE